MLKVLGSGAQELARLFIREAVAVGQNMGLDLFKSPLYWSGLAQNLRRD